MNKYLLISIGLMLLLFIVSQAIETSEIGLISSGSYDFDNSTGEAIVDGSTTEYGFGGYNLILGISLTEGIMISAIAIGALVIIIGISIATWSISETAQRGILNFSIYGAIWGIFNVTTYNLLTQLDLFGWILFFIISFIHFSGIIININGSGSG